MLYLVSYSDGWNFAIQLKRREKVLFALTFYAIGLLLSSFYRPYIYQNNIQDFGIADIGNNIVFVPGVYFLWSLILRKPTLGIYKDIILLTSFLIVFEILSFYVNGIGTFDLKDILGLFIGAGITCLIVRLRTKNVISE